uniref:Predicted protein n=1 Tax=Hordeum vulgare subsp. vulgare TaxID=112509 RepID=F2D5W9_HORVV|nr:predicted protein [Hordeum vulgare subsp. vulgare]
MQLGWSGGEERTRDLNCILVCSAPLGIVP